MNLRTSRKSKNISQLRLAHLSGVSRHRIYLAEQGFIKLTAKELKTISETILKYNGAAYES